MTNGGKQAVRSALLLLVCSLGWLSPVTAGTTSVGLSRLSSMTLQSQLPSSTSSNNGLLAPRSRALRSSQPTRSPLVMRLLEEREVTGEASASFELAAPEQGAHDVRLEHSYQQYHINTDDPGVPREGNHGNEIADPNYKYVYEVQGEKGSGDFGHTEMRDGGKTWGRYFVHQPDGRVKTVRYWADHTGYHAEVDYHTEGSQEGAE